MDNKLFFINCPVHRQDPNGRTARPKETKGANVCTRAKGEEIQKISAAVLFSSQQPANTYSRSANFCALIKKIQSTGMISEKFTLTQEVFSFPLNRTPNQIIRFHPSFLQRIFHNQSSKIWQKGKVLVRKYNNQIITKGSLFSDTWDKQVYLSLELHHLVTFMSLLFWKINIPVGKELSCQRWWQTLLQQLPKALISGQKGCMPEYALCLLEAEFPAAPNSCRQVS